MTTYSQQYIDRCVYRCVVFLGNFDKKRAIDETLFFFYKSYSNYIVTRFNSIRLKKGK